MAYARFQPTYRYGASVAGLAASGFSGTRSQWMSGRSRSRTGYGKKVRGRYTSGTSLTQKIRSLETTQHSYIGNGVNFTLNMLDNVIYTWSPSQAIAIGTGPGTRTGTEVYLMSLRCDIVVQSPTASQNGCTYRVITFMADQNYALSGAMGTGFTAPGLFGDVAVNVITNSLTDPKLIDVIDDRIIQIDPVITGVKNSETTTYVVPVYRKFQYCDTAADKAYGKFKNLYQVVIGHQIGATGGVTNVGDVYVSTDLSFKNSK